MQALGSVLTTVPSALLHAIPHLHPPGIVWSAASDILPIQIWGMVQLLFKGVSLVYWVALTACYSTCTAPFTAKVVLGSFELPSTTVCKRSTA